MKEWINKCIYNLTLPIAVHYFGYLNILITAKIRMSLQMAPVSIYSLTKLAVSPSVVPATASNVEE